MSAEPNLQCYTNHDTVCNDTVLRPARGAERDDRCSA